MIPTESNAEEGEFGPLWRADYNDKDKALRIALVSEKRSYVVLERAIVRGHFYVSKHEAALFPFNGPLRLHRFSTSKPMNPYATRHLRGEGKADASQAFRRWRESLKIREMKGKLVIGSLHFTAIVAAQPS